MLLIMAWADLSRSVWPLSLKRFKKIIIDMLLIITEQAGTRQPGYLGRSSLGCSILSFNLDFYAHPKKDHGLIRPGQGNQDIGEGAHRRQCQARKSKAIWSLIASLAQRSSPLTHLSRKTHWKVGSKYNSLVIPLKVPLSTPVPHLL